MLAVQREHGHAIAHGQHQGGLGAVDAVAGGHLLGAGLEEVAVMHTGVAFRLLEHAEDGADRHVDVDVGRAIQGVEHQQVFALRITVGHHVDAFHFLGSHGCQVAAPFVGFDQGFIGDDVQLLLHFALHVFAAGGAHDVTQLALVHGKADALAGAGDDFQQQTQLAGDQAVHALLLDQVAGQADVFLHERKLLKNRGKSENGNGCWAPTACCAAKRGWPVRRLIAGSAPDGRCPVGFWHGAHKPPATAGLVGAGLVHGPAPSAGNSSRK